MFDGILMPIITENPSPQELRQTEVQGQLRTTIQELKLDPNQGTHKLGLLMFLLAQ